MTPRATIIYHNHLLTCTTINMFTSNQVNIWVSFNDGTENREQRTGLVELNVLLKLRTNNSIFLLRTKVHDIHVNDFFLLSLLVKL